MLERWRSQPPWVLGLGMGGLFAAGMFVVGIVQGYQWIATLVGALIAGAIFGAFMGPWAGRQRREAEAAVGGSSETYLAASRTLRLWGRGHGLRTDADRAAAAGLARQRLKVLDSQRVWGTLVFLGVSAVAAWLALTRSPWWWLEVAFFGVILVITWSQRRRLRRIVGGV